MREVVFIKQKNSRIRAFSVAAAALGCMIYASAFPQPAAASALRALRLCGGTVVPSLCLFLIAARVLAESGIAGVLSAAEFPKRLFGVSGGGLLVMAVGLISGYPTGAATASGLCEKNNISREEAEALLPFVNNAGPAFLIGAVGNGMFGDKRVGIVILLAQTVSALALLAITGKRRDVYDAPVVISENTNISSVVSLAVVGGGAALISVCAFVTVFTVISDAAVNILSLFGIGGIVSALVRGAFEITSGLYDLGLLFGKNPLVCVTAAGGMVGFSGLSVMMQVFDSASRGGVPTGKYLRGKTLMALSCALLSGMFYAVFCEKSIKTTIMFGAIFLISGIVCTFIKKLSKKGGKMKTGVV